jgi:serine/threonine protein kinase
MMRLAQGKQFVKLEAVYETQNSVYLVMELMHGGEILKQSLTELESSLKPQEVK